MTTLATGSVRCVRRAVAVVAGIAVAMTASLSFAQTSFDQGYNVNATRDDPDVGSVSDTRSQRFNYFFPFFTQGLFTNGSATVTRTDTLPDGSGLYFGSANSNGGALAGDRFVKASTLSGLDFTTGSADATAFATWTSSATPGTNTLADVSVLLDRRLFFGDFLTNTDRGNQIQDYANANVPTFQQADALTLSAGVFLNVLIREAGTGVFWNALLQEEVNRSFLFVKDVNGFPVVVGGTGDQAYTRLSYGTNVSGAFVGSQSSVENLLNFDATGYPPRLGTTSSSIYGINNVFLRSDRTYDISMSLQCYSAVSALSGLAEASAYSAGCDAGNSGYWLGLNNFRDFNGNAIAPVALTSADTGLDLGGASPLAPGGGQAIPEPTTWALMIFGFGLAGAALRRRRAAMA